MRGDNGIRAMTKNAEFAESHKSAAYLSKQTPSDRNAVPPALRSFF